MYLLDSRTFCIYRRERERERSARCSILSFAH